MGNSETRRRAAAIRLLQIEAKRPGFEDRDCPRFIADVMLGRLAKWLRLAGFDVLYSNNFDDDEIIEISNRERRVLLSRDTRLLIRRAVKEFVFPRSELVQEQVKEVFAAVHLSSLAAPLTRCLSCNEPLGEIPRESVEGRVPPYVFETQKSFKSCVSCGRIFWAGTHRASVIRSLERLLAARDEGTAGREHGE